MSHKIFCIIGRSASGKSTITNNVANKLGMKILKSYTTRTMRKEETQGRAAAETFGIYSWFARSGFLQSYAFFFAGFAPHRAFLQVCRCGRVCVRREGRARRPAKENVGKFGGSTGSLYLCLPHYNKVGSGRMNSKKEIRV